MYTINSDLILYFFFCFLPNPLSLLAKTSVYGLIYIGIMSLSVYT